MELKKEQADRHVHEQQRAAGTWNKKNMVACCFCICTVHGRTEQKEHIPYCSLVPLPCGFDTYAPLLVVVPPLPPFAFLRRIVVVPLQTLVLIFFAIPTVALDAFCGCSRCCLAFNTIVAWLPVGCCVLLCCLFPCFRALPALRSWTPFAFSLALYCCLVHVIHSGLFVAVPLPLVRYPTDVPTCLYLVAFAGGCNSSLLIARSFVILSFLVQRCVAFAGATHYLPLCVVLFTSFHVPLPFAPHAFCRDLLFLLFYRALFILSRVESDFFCLYVAASLPLQRVGAAAF